MREDGATWLDEETWEVAQEILPIVCVDLVPVRRGWTGEREVALIRRRTPFDGLPDAWCHLGGRVHRNESIRAALLRHLHWTVDGAHAELPADPQPDYVMQWFPDPWKVAGPAPRFGVDPRKHAVALSFAVEVTGYLEVAFGGEALEVRWFSPGEVGRLEPMWPGSRALVLRLLAGRDGGCGHV